MRKKIAAMIMALCVSATVDAQVLSLDGYLGQVRQENDQVRGALNSSRGSEERSVEGGLLFSPRLFSELYVMDDKRETLMPASQGTETTFNNAEIGVSQVTRYGLAGKLYYGLGTTDILNVNRAYIPQPKYADSGITLELSQPLWQNAGGKQYRNSERYSFSQAQAGSYSKRYEAQLVLMNAETRFWKLSAARESIAIITATLERTQHILTFNRNKANRGLADSSDVLQAEAMVQARKLDLVRAQSDEKQAAREFNTLRNLDSDIAREEVSLPPMAEVLQLLSADHRRAELRNDVKAAELGVQALTAAGEIGSDKTKPDVSVYAVASLNNRGGNAGDAAGDAFSVDHPYYAAGLKLSIPLDIARTGSVQGGYRKEIEGAQQQYRQKKRDQDMEWKTLMTRMQDTREALIAADALQKAQFTKLENERARQKMGRSTMFQVFSFEQEYLASQLNLVSLRANALALIAQAKTFSDFSY